jgi:hypothetical protein
MVPVLCLDIKPHHAVLDMCASPGSKTSQVPINPMLVFGQLLFLSGCLFSIERNLIRLFKLYSTHPDPALYKFFAELLHVPVHFLIFLRNVL